MQPYCMTVYHTPRISRVRMRCRGWGMSEGCLKQAMLKRAGGDAETNVCEQVASTRCSLAVI